MKKVLLQTVIAATIALPAISQAAVLFTFDPAPGGAASAIPGIATIDQSPGNALSIDGANVSAGGNSTLLYQANLGTLQDGNGTAVFTNGNVVDGANRYFTFVAGFNENIASVTLDPVNHKQTADFNLAPGAPNFFRMYANTTGAGNNLTGVGFATGTLILSGTILAGNFTSSFTENLTPANTRTATQAFDQTADGNQYPGVTTVVGSGATSLRIGNLVFDNSYFTNATANQIAVSFLNTTQKTPFQEVNPSAAFNATGLPGGDAGTPDAIGAQNGLSGPNFQFQADANQSFDVVPEPGTMVLFGLGLVGLGVAMRRRA